MLSIEKFDPDKTYTALYYDASVKAFYVKRFSFVLSDNTPLSFIAEGRGSYLVDLSEDLHPQFQVTFGGKNASRSPEAVDAEEYIGKKGIAAKGKKCSDRWEVASVAFIEPLHKPEDDAPQVPEEEFVEIDMNDIIDIDTPEQDLGEIPEIEELTLF